ncbi:hypothetical protein D9613_000427 [Agrocybe pediades]|uniref:Release factor glutamine methyltransferase N-terminal domain-containing protein n=1 Tax=Agrocybe pediades TaxID=84607 RepID=A0A8H4R2P3_9AGAR|nr:hypothetical protein D9613_000427 [Agrocybe pediades]
MFTRLLLSLSSTLGRTQASRELKWMQQAIDSRAVTASLDDMVSRRVRGEPLQYILGTQPFGPLNLLTRPPVLIPRPETEHWVMRLAESLSPTAQRPISLLDLGTGSGCIPLLLCKLWPPGSLKAYGVDISPHALSLAQDNAALCGFSRMDGDKSLSTNTFKAVKASFLDHDFLKHGSSVNPPFDVVTSNPPYISWNEYLDLDASVSDFEDPKALFGGPDGLDFYHAIRHLVSREGFLTPSATVALEVGHTQANAVENMMRGTGRFRSTEVWLDPWGKQRTVVARV